jgi:prolyl-tRNA editing enzyme YbaK/EbsC (Cys-tRNA(Pro) deacylase)
MRYLREQGGPFVEHRYEHRVKGAALAAAALGLDPAMVAKTLVAQLTKASRSRWCRAAASCLCAVSRARRARLRRLRSGTPSG